jgi:hypothetical protein
VCECVYVYESVCMPLCSQWNVCCTLSGRVCSYKYTPPSLLSLVENVPIFLLPFLIACAIEYYSFNIRNDKNVSELHCPYPACKMRMPPHGLKLLLPPDVYELYQEATIRVGCVVRVAHLRMHAFAVCGWDTFGSLCSACRVG